MLSKILSSYDKEQFSQRLPNCEDGTILKKGTNGRQKTYEISHVYSIFYSGFMCQTTVIFGITKEGSLY